MLIDIHTHRDPPYPQGIISVSVTPDGEELPEDQCWSIGIHPWDSSAHDLQARLLTLERAARMKQVVAIGEAGIDLSDKHTPMPLAMQMELLRYHALTAETVRKPLILHAVKAHVQIIGMHKELHPAQPWIIHGFRSKPSIAELYLNEGIMLSFGERFNTETLRLTPPQMRMAETDESSLSISGIIALQSVAAGVEQEEYMRQVATNMTGLFRMGLTWREP